MSDKVYVGSGWESKYGVNLSIKKSEIEKLETDKYGNVFLCVNPRREPDAKSKATHYICVDSYRYENMGGMKKEEAPF